MRKLLAKIQKAVVAALKKMGRGGKATWNFLFGRSGGAPALEEPELAGEEPSAEQSEAVEAEQVADMALERKKRGLEPSDVKEFAEAKTFGERLKIADRMTPKTREWAMGLFADQRAILASSDIRSIGAHLEGIQTIKSVPAIPFGMRFPDPMPNRYRSDLATSLTQELKPEQSPRATLREKLKAKQIAGTGPDVSLLFYKEEQYANRFAARQSALRKARDEKNAGMSVGMKPPRRMMA